MLIFLFCLFIKFISIISIISIFFYYHISILSKTEKMQIPILNLLLIIFIILLTYCIMYHFIYKYREIKFYDNDNNDNNDNNNNNNNNNIYQTSERFNNSIVNADDASQYLNNLAQLQSNINTYNSIYMPGVSTMLNDTKIQLANQNSSISNILTNRIILKYIDTIDKANAVAYREYMKYNKNETKNLY